jgi:hypothetical protein
MSVLVIGVILVVAGVAIGGAAFAMRRLRSGVDVDTGAAGGVLSYVSAAFAILLGFVIVFLLGQAMNARQAIGDEATAIGTAFDEAQLFPDGEEDIQYALICYSRAVTEREWDTLADGRSAPEADDTYRALIATYGDIDGSTDSVFQPGAATNSFVQIGGISTARETRIVAATSHIGPLMWVLLFGAAVLVLILLFVVTTAARPIIQALLLGFAGLFTAAMLALVLVLNSPFSEAGPLEPTLIEDNTERMVTLAPEAAAQPCSFDDESESS